MTGGALRRSALRSGGGGVKKLKRIRKNCVECGGSGIKTKYGIDGECPMCEGYGWYYECPNGDGKRGLAFMELPPRAKKKFVETKETDIQRKKQGIVSFKIPIRTESAAGGRAT